MAHRWLICFAILLFAAVPARAQTEIGLPFIKNYTPSDYNESPQNMCITQDQRGMMYFANIAGVLEYDGVSWRCIKVANKTNVLSVSADTSGTVYVGAQAELGYLEPDKNGKTQYVSLMPKVPAKDKVFNDVWQVVATKEGVFFRTDKNILLYKDGKFTSFYPQKSYFRIYYVYGKVYINEQGVGLLRFGNGSMQKIMNSDIFGNSRINAMFPYSGGNILIATVSQGFFVFEPQKDYVPFVALETIADEELRSSHIYHGAALPGNKFAIATTRNGIYIFSNKGQLLQHITQKSGLQDDIATYLFVDREQNLWVALNNGISKLDINSPLGFFNYDKGLSAEVQSIIRHNGKLYMATVQGTYVMDTGVTDSLTALPGFTLLPNSEAQSFVLAETRESRQGKPHLLVGSAEGIAEIKDNKYTQVWGEAAVFRLYVPSRDPSLVVASTEQGLHLFRYVNGKLQHQGSNPKITDPVFNIEVDDKGNIWTSTAYNGVIRIRSDLSDLATTNSITYYDTLKGLPSMNGTYFYKWSGHVLLGTDKGLYEYDSKSDSFVKSMLLGPGLQGLYEQVFVLTEDHKGNCWLTGIKNNKNKIIYVYKDKDGKIQWDDASFRRVSDMSVFYIYPESSNVTWFGSSEGLLKYDSNAMRDYSGNRYNVLIRKVKAGKDSLLFSGSNYTVKVAGSDTVRMVRLTQQEDQQATLDYAHNSMLFEFAALNFFDEHSNQYSYLLEGFDEEWSEWSPETKKEYNNLSPGTYIFRVKAKNVYDVESGEASYTFTILPPWYRTLWAYLLYILLFIILVRLLVKLSVMRLSAAKEKLERVVEERTQELREEKELVETQKNAIVSQNNNLAVAYREIEQKNKDITDSINYAKRIQEAMLPSARRMKELLPESFIFYQPKDIISGDFYWFTEKNGMLFMAAADCTGHGVPGALMSMIGISFLNQLVNERQLTDTGEILGSLHKNVLRALNEDISARQSKDGMDIALIRIDRASRTVQYSGAVRPLYHIENNQLQIIKGDRFSIGGVLDSEQEKFSSHIIDYTSPAMFYMFSDGIIDQFGLPAEAWANAGRAPASDKSMAGKEKKFMAKKLQDLLLSIASLPAEEQSSRIAAAINSWKGKLEQVDDMLVAGVRL